MVEPPLWTDIHAPDLADLPQDDVREYLRRGIDEPLNLVLYGPPGVGKTAAVRALAREAHEESENDLVEINVADFFDRTKSEIREDPRFAHFLQGTVSWTKRADVDTKYKRNWSKADMINHVLTESAAVAPASGGYRTILLDNAETIREDFQQALRRVMERYARSTQFVITTRQPSKLIAPIHSRSFPVPMRAPTHGETVGVLRDIVTAEGVEYDEEGLEYVAGYAEGDLRTAILGAQTAAETEGAVTMDAAYEALGEVGVDNRVREMLDAAEDGEFTDARGILDDLLVDEGLDGVDVLAELLTVARGRYTGRQLAELHELAGEIDLDLELGTNDRLHVSHLLAELGN